MQRADGFGRWWTIAEGTVRPDRVVVFTPFLDDDLSLFEGVKYFPVEQLVPEPGVEALAVAILPWRSRDDIGGLCTNRGNPVPDSFGYELGSVVRPDEGRRSS